MIFFKDLVCFGSNFVSAFVVIMDCSLSKNFSLAPQLGTNDIQFISKSGGGPEKLYKINLGIGKVKSGYVWSR